MRERYTVFGATGFVGAAVVRLLDAQNHDVMKVTRTNWPMAGAELGHVIFTIGMTADFRSRLVETVETQVIRLHEAMTRYSFKSFTYLSSARVYDGAPSTHEETLLVVRPHLTDHVYNISKLAGESLCCAFDNPACRVVRLSNVYGAQDISNLFLTAVMREAVETGSVTIGQSAQSSKDYIWIDHVAEALIKIATHGRQRIYNLASGINVTHQRIADILQEAGYKVTFKDGGAKVVIPSIDISRLTEDFGIHPKDTTADMGRVLKSLQQAWKNKAGK